MRTNNASLAYFGWNMRLAYAYTRRFVGTIPGSIVAIGYLLVRTAVKEEE